MTDPLPEKVEETQPKKSLPSRQRKANEPKLTIDLADKYIKELVVHANVKQELIVTTTDKLRLCLTRCKDSLGGRAAWVAPLSTFLTVLTVLVAADFKDLLLTRQQWQVIFLLAAGVALFWLIQSSWKSFKAWRSVGLTDPVEDIVAKLKSESPEIISETVQEPPRPANAPPQATGDSAS